MRWTSKLLRLRTGGNNYFTRVLRPLPVRRESCRSMMGVLLLRLSLVLQLCLLHNMQGT